LTFRLDVCLEIKALAVAFVRSLYLSGAYWWVGNRKTDEALLLLQYNPAAMRGDAFSYGLTWTGQFKSFRRFFCGLQDFDKVVLWQVILVKDLWDFAEFISQGAEFASRTQDLHDEIIVSVSDSGFNHILALLLLCCARLWGCVSLRPSDYDFGQNWKPRTREIPLLSLQLGAIEAQWFWLWPKLEACDRGDSPTLRPSDSDFGQNWKPGTIHTPFSLVISQSSCTCEHVEIKWLGTTRTQTRDPLILGRS
jgi:hypothetical protein